MNEQNYFEQFSGEYPELNIGIGTKVQCLINCRIRRGIITAYKSSSPMVLVDYGDGNCSIVPIKELMLDD